MTERRVEKAGTQKTAHTSQDGPVVSGFRDLFAGIQRDSYPGTRSNSADELDPRLAELAPTYARTDEEAGAWWFLYRAKPEA